MSHFITYAEIFDGKVSEDFGVRKIEGSSLTIPGQGCDLAQIVSSIVKLPDYDKRDYDVQPGEDPDLSALQVKTDLEGLYTPEGVNLAQDAKARQNEREQAKNVNEVKKEEGGTTDDDDAK